MIELSENNRSCGFQRRKGWDRRASILASLSGLSACSGVGPDYAPPTIALAETFVENGATQSGDVAGARWWTGLGDQKLNSLVARGLAQNLSVNAALQAVSEAQANARAAGLGNQITGGWSRFVKDFGAISAIP